MTRFKFLGAAGMVTGSGYWLNNKPANGLLIDLGMFMGPEPVDALNYEALDIDVTDLAGVILTHAHLDHCGRLPMLVGMGYSGPIYMTKATLRLTKLSLHDAARIAKHDHYRKPMYSAEDVDELLSRARVVDYHEPFSIGDYEARLVDAGHILGSASVILKDGDGKTLVFSGDLGNSPEDIVKPTELIDGADVVVMESTYGGRLHPKEDPLSILQAEINAIETDGGVLLVPAFSLERTQVLLHMIDHMKTEGKVEQETPVYLDSPMAIEATRIYKQFTGLYSRELSLHSRDDDPFDFPGLKITRKHNQSERIWRTQGPKVIIAGSGMMSGGRIMNHAAHYLPKSSTRLLIVGYQAEETLGREILEGAETVVIDGNRVEVNATISEISAMSAHADSRQLLDWLKHIRGVKKVFLTHGEDAARQALVKEISDFNPAVSAVLPKLYDEMEVFA